MSRLAVDRLWPMLAGLGVLLAGAVALEGYAARRGNETLRVVIADGAGGDEGDEGDGAEAEPGAPDGPPVSGSHALARRAARRALHEEAIGLYEKVLEESPGAAAVEQEFGALLVAAGDPRRALPHLERGDALAPGPDSAFRLGLARDRLGDDAGAERDLRRALALRPSHAAARVALGALLQRRGDAAGAIALLEPAARTGANEDRARALVALGRAYLAAGRRPDAERSFDEAILFAPARVEVRTGIARAWLASDAPADVTRALAVVERAAEMAPDVPRVHALLGRARERAGDAAGAADAYHRALRLYPSYRYARRRVLRVALQLRDLARARQHAERLAADAPADPEHHFLVALVADRDGRDEDARRAYRKAIEVAKGDYPEAYLNLGVLEKGAGNPAAARAAYEQAIALRPGYAAAWQNLAKLHEAAGDLAAAEAAYGKVLELEPRHASAWLARGQLRSQAGRIEEAIQDLRAAAAARKGYDAAELSLGVAYRRAGRLGDAIETYRGLLERSPRYVSAWYNLALSLQASGRTADARAAFAKAAALDPEHAPSRVALADLDLAEGKVAEARRGFTEALDLAPGDLVARAALAEIAALEGDPRGCEARARALRAEVPQDPRVQALGARCAAARGRSAIPATRSDAP